MTIPNIKPISVAVIGGGFGGLSVAIGLQKYPHIDVQVYEAADKFAEIGAGVHLGPNSQRAMEYIDPRIKAGYEKRAAYAVSECREDGEFPWLSLYKGQPPNSNEKVVAFYHPGRGSSIHRAHFLDELVQLVEPERAHFGKRLDHIYESNEADSPIILQFKDGTISTCDVLIGADGVHSPTRAHILPPNDPSTKATFTGGVIYRAVVPMMEAVAKLGEIKQESGLRCGKDAIVVGFPLANGTLYNLAVTMFNLPPWEHEKWIVPTEVSVVKKHFEDWDPYVRKQVELLPEGGKTLAWSVWDMPPAPYYSRGRIAIMGDAAHASTPYQGAGAGQAIEDAMVLSHLLGKCLDPAEIRNDNYTQNAQRIIPLLLQAYDAVRRFRSQKAVVTSREMGDIVSGAEPSIGLDIEKMRHRLDGREDWIWRDDTWKQVEDGLLIFGALKAAGERYDKASSLL